MISNHEVKRNTLIKQSRAATEGDESNAIVLTEQKE